MQLGDVVIGRDSDRTWIVHRVVRTNAPSTGVVIKGDYALASDCLSRDQVWGKVVALRRHDSGREIQLTTSRLDRWIARLSYDSTRSHYVMAKLRRKTVLLLGSLRRIAL
jgi:hypothetical protein